MVNSGEARLIHKILVGCVQQSGTHQILGGGAFRFAAHTLP
jgi:hypothetical protein